jgi:hypothetical protein
MTRTTGPTSFTQLMKKAIVLRDGGGTTVLDVDVDASIHAIEFDQHHPGALSGATNLSRLVSEFSYERCMDTTVVLLLVPAPTPFHEQT